ncbi:MAG TPA: N-formylglutamate amidohydrolase [Methylomirabilota bacterium]|nr:N-formylglutamate amidohydrolase [Methylomirabilota bacterium]
MEKLLDDGMAPFAIENRDGRGAAVIVVDHASNRIPDSWGDLGLTAEAREEHIAWDPGALAVARHMSRILDAPLIAGTVSRLVVDLNRPLGSATLAPAVSETTTSPGNAAISAADMKHRVEAVYTPYHQAVEAMVSRQVAVAAEPVAVIAVHTFTPVYKGVARALQVGILFDRDDRLGLGMLDVLKGEDGLAAAANEPYSPADEVYHTLDRHASSRGLPSAMIEIRNDVVRTPADQQRWAERLAGAVTRARGGLDRGSPLTSGSARPLRDHGTGPASTTP